MSKPPAPTPTTWAATDPRIPEAVVFNHLIAALVFGAGYERIADQQVSATTLARRRNEWIRDGLFVKLAALAVVWEYLPPPGDYDAMIGLDRGDVAGDGCITRAPAGVSALGAALSTVNERSRAFSGPVTARVSR